MAAATLRPNQRGHILDVTLRIMSEQGAAKTSMRQLARECGINVATLYHYFESKDALLAAVIEERRYGARLAEPPEIPAHLSVDDRLRLVFATVWQGALAEEPIWRLLLGEALRGEPTAIPVGQSLLDVLGPGLAAWVAAAIPELEEPEAVADLLLGQLFAGFVRHIFQPDLDVAEIERTGGDAIATAVAPPGAP